MYEISFILKTEDGSSLRKLLARYGAEAPAGEEFKKIRLAYPVKKSEYGFLGSFRFEVKPEDLEKIIKDLKLEENLLRYLVTKLEERKIEAGGERRVPQVALMTKRVDEPKRHTEPVLTNEELEKKIEEILK